MILKALNLVHEPKFFKKSLKNQNVAQWFLQNQKSSQSSTTQARKNCILLFRNLLVASWGQVVGSHHRGGGLLGGLLGDWVGPGGILGTSWEHPGRILGGFWGLGLGLVLPQQPHSSPTSCSKVAQKRPKLRFSMGQLLPLRMVLWENPGGILGESWGAPGKILGGIGKANTCKKQQPQTKTQSEKQT